MSETLDTLPTPALILDRAILLRNTRRMSEKLAAAGVALRPHVKTAKSLEVARLATQGHDGRITVSTLAEARYFAAGGFKDIFYAVGIVPSKLPAISALRRQGANLRVVTDNLPVARAIAEAGRGGESFSVFIEIDSGAGRAGLPYPDLSALLEIARTLHEAPNVELAGVMTHGGHSYHENTVAGIRRAADQERTAVTAAAKMLRDAGLPCPIVSAGSTPTTMHGQSFEGITEMRPGVYVFNDLDQVGIGSCGAGDMALSVMASVIGHYPHRNQLLIDAGALALSVMASVIGHYPHRNQLLIDAGALALSKDISAQEFMPKAGYGTIMDAPVAELAVVACSQEHGFVGADAALPYDKLPIGSRVRILPNHACITAAAYDRYYVVDSEEGDGRTVVATYDRVNGW